MDQGENIDHTHCRTCYRINCGSKGSPVVTNCPVIACPLKCGVRFHGCKLDEHKDACELERVECINSVNGCPMIIQRNKLGSHLERCPASVVFCTMEWNRWPVYSHERQSRVPFVGDNLHAQYGQLDVALALRDQRMLNQAMKAPRSTRRALRNNLTQRFPAVPIHLNPSSSDNTTPDNSSSGTESTKDSIPPRKKVEYPPGLERSICNALFQANRSAVESLTTPGRGNVIIDSGTDAASGIEGREETEEPGIDNSVMCHAAQPVNTDHSLEERFINDDKNSENQSASPAGTEDVSPAGDKEGEDASEKPNIPDPPCIAPLNPLKEPLALDLNLESITRYQAKPKSMYTFLCAQEFRRDEYWGHFKSIHDFIHPGLNGWLEQRCPLAQYGCTYSMRRFYPDEKGSEIIHNDILGSFGIRPKLPPHQKDQPIHDTRELLIDEKPTYSKEYLASTEQFCETECIGNYNDKSDEILNGQNYTPSEVPKDELSAMPFEVLRYIALFLDGYSLCNLALTSRKLREVTCSLLEEKGIVIQQWERKLVDGKPSWSISHKRWIYSTAFSNVKKWGFEDYTPIGDHLKVCPFFHRAETTTPHHLPSMKCGQHHSDNFYDVMKRMYPEFTAFHNEEEPLCTTDAGLC